MPLKKSVEGLQHVDRQQHPAMWPPARGNQISQGSNTKPRIPSQPPSYSNIKNLKKTKKKKKKKKKKNTHVLCGRVRVEGACLPCSRSIRHALPHGVACQTSLVQNLTGELSCTCSRTLGSFLPTHALIRSV